jgi:predicted regulator of Ras-like GTPase activity (Roadblock/LC7/MglB family)
LTFVATTDALVINQMLLSDDEAEWVKAPMPLPPAPVMMAT